MGTTNLQTSDLQTSKPLLETPAKQTGPETGERLQFERRAAPTPNVSRPPATPVAKPPTPAQQDHPLNRATLEQPGALNLSPTLLRLSLLVAIGLMVLGLISAPQETADPTNETESGETSVNAAPPEVLVQTWD